jgi:ABC-type glycerol-3-phosphate transport system permease component
MADTAQQTEALRRVDGGRKPPRKPRSLADVTGYTVLTLGVVVALFPFFWMVSASVMTLADISAGKIIPNKIHLENYSQAWDMANFKLFMWNSTRITAITITGLLVFCVPAAYAFARMNFSGRNTLFVLMLSTLMIPQVVTLIPNFLTIVWLGRLGQTVCGNFCAWYNNWPALTIPFMATAFAIFLLRQFFAQIPSDYWDAAQIDGAGHVTFLLRVVVPLSKAPILTVAMFAFIGSWNSLLWPLLVTQTDQWRPVAVGLTKFVSSDAPGDFHLQMAASVIMVIPILIFYFFTQKQFTEGIASSGLKG